MLRIVFRGRKFYVDTRVKINIITIKFNSLVKNSGPTQPPTGSRPSAQPGIKKGPKGSETGTAEPPGFPEDKPDMTGATPKTKKTLSAQRILDAATEVFADAGFAGARMDDIARRAGINKAMIYYRIGDKATLYAEVMHRTFRGIADRMEKNLKRARSPEERLRIYVRTFARTLDENPSLPPMMLREISSGGEHAPDILIADLAHILRLLMTILKEGSKRGVFIDANPILVHLMIVGPMAMKNRMDAIVRRHEEHVDFVAGIERGHPGYFRDLEELVLRALLRQGAGG